MEVGGPATNTFSILSGTSTSGPAGSRDSACVHEEKGESRMQCLSFPRRVSAPEAIARQDVLAIVAQDEARELRCRRR